MPKSKRNRVGMRSAYSSPLLALSHMDRDPNICAIFFSKVPKARPPNESIRQRKERKSLLQFVQPALGRSFSSFFFKFSDFSNAVTLSKTKKKGREHKESIANSIRQALDNYSSVYVFSFENMRNLKFKEFREQLKSSSRFFLGSNKVMQISLGRSVSDESKPGMHKVSKFLRGNTGLLFTNLSKEEVQRLFEEFEEHDFARTGSIATEKVELKEGPLEQFTHEMEPFLRKQGMPVRLNKGVVELVSDFVVCKEGESLSPDSSRILRLLGIKMATFRLHLVCRWSSEDFEVYREGLDLSDVESS